MSTITQQSAARTHELVRVTHADYTIVLVGWYDVLDSEIILTDAQGHEWRKHFTLDCAPDEKIRKYFDACPEAFACAVRERRWCVYRGDTTMYIDFEVPHISRHMMLSMTATGAAPHRIIMVDRATMTDTASSTGTAVTVGMTEGTAEGMAVGMNPNERTLNVLPQWRTRAQILEVDHRVLHLWLMVTDANYAEFTTLFAHAAPFSPCIYGERLWRACVEWRAAVLGESILRAKVGRYGRIEGAFMIHSAHAWVARVCVADDEYACGKDVLQLALDADASAMVEGMNRMRLATTELINSVAHAVQPLASDHHSRLHRMRAAHAGSHWIEVLEAFAGAPLKTYRDPFYAAVYTAACHNGAKPHTDTLQPAPGSALADACSPPGWVVIRMP